MSRFITSLQHPLVKHLVKLRQNSEYRYEQKSLLLEGSKPIREVIGEAKKLIFSQSFPPFGGSNAEEWIVTDAILQKISGLSSPEGVIAEVEMPSPKTLKECHHLLIFDGVNDPGNMGTLLRTALAFGWDGIFVLPGSCDVFNEKVLRAARGAHFKLPFNFGSVKELHELLIRHNFQPLLADLQGENPGNIPIAAKRALIVGNEAHGASDEVRQFSLPVAIPMPGEMESLNVAVAGGILLYLLHRK